MSEYVISSRRGWGRHRFQTDALRIMLGNHGSNIDDTEEIHISHVKGFDYMKGSRVFADEFLSEKKIEVDGEKLRRMYGLMGEIETLGEDVLMEATVLEER